MRSRGGAVHYGEFHEEGTVGFAARREIILKKYPTFPVITGHFIGKTRVNGKVNKHE